MEENENILGCFIFGPAIYYDAAQKTKDLASEQEKLFPTLCLGRKRNLRRFERIKT